VDKLLVIVLIQTEEVQARAVVEVAQPTLGQKELLGV